MDPNKKYKIMDSESELHQKFYDQLKKLELKKINEVIDKAFVGKAFIAAIGNPDPPGGKFSTVKGIEQAWNAVGTVGQGGVNFKGLHPDYVIFDEAPSMQEIQKAYLDLAVDSDKFKAALMALDPPIWQTASPVKMFGKSFTCYVEVRDDKGKMIMIPLSQPPMLETEYTVADGPQAKMLNPAITVEAVHQVFEDGETTVIKGPFTVQGVWNQVKQPVKIVKEPVTLKAKSITIDHKGTLHNLSVGDYFTIDFNVDLVGNHPAAGVVFKHQETVKVVGFNYGQDAPDFKPSPFLLNKKSPEEEVKLRERQHRSNGTFSSTWIEKKKCFLIAGYHGNKRYEVILGEPIPLGSGSKALEELFGHGEPVPQELRLMIRNCNTALIGNLRERTDAFKHPKLHSIKVKCPGLGEKFPKVISFNNKGCDYHNGEPADIFNLIQHLNDSHKWTREQIADWIDTLDEQPVFYPIIELERMANSARVVVVESPF